MYKFLFLFSIYIYIYIFMRKQNHISEVFFNAVTKPVLNNYHIEQMSHFVASVLFLDESDSGKYYNNY